MKRKLIHLPVTSTRPNEEKQNPWILGMTRQTPKTKRMQPMAEMLRKKARRTEKNPYYIGAASCP